MYRTRTIRTRALSTLALALCATLGACDSEDELDLDDTRDAPSGEVQPRAALFSADELFLKLKEAEAQLPAPAAEEVVDMGTFNAATGVFTGLTSTPGGYDPEWGIVFPPIPASAPIDAINATLHFEITGALGMSRVTIGGTNYYDWDQDGEIDVDVSRAQAVNWTIASSGKSYNDDLFISRIGVDGAGAFTLSAWPIAMLYEPPTNNAATNDASFTTITQRTSTTTFTDSSESSETAPPPFVDLNAVFDKLESLGDKLGMNHPAGLLLSNIGNLFGTVKTEIVNGTSVSSSHTIEFSTSDMLSITTSADMGPGRGDVVGYLKNARVAWVMENGNVSVTLIDFESQVYVPFTQIRQDLAEVRGGGTASWTGLDELSLESLANINPFVEGGEGAELDPDRFVYDNTFEIGGVALQVNSSHTHTVSDTMVESSFQTRVRDADAGWLSALGFGSSENGKTKTTMKQSSTRSVEVGETTTAEFMLGAEVDENYSVNVYYDRLFGTFAVRRDGGGDCPVFDPDSPDGGFCDDPACPCYAGEGDCDSDDQCAGDLVCGHDNGPNYGLPGGWDVCVPVFCPEFDPNDPDGALCNDPDCPCEIATGDCDNDAQCAGDLVCGHDNGPLFGLPSGWDVCIDDACPVYDPDVHDWNFCTPGCPCGFGQGDCDNDDQCAGDLVCGHDNGPEFGLPSYSDACVLADD